MMMILTAALLTAAATGCRRVDAPAADPDGLRIVSLAPNLTEIVFAVGAGDRLAGRTSACDYPPESRAVPVVGGFGAPSLEMLTAARPTVTLYADMGDKPLIARMAEHGLNPQYVRCVDLDDIPAALETVAAIGGTPETGQAAAADLRTAIAAARRAAEADARRPRVYVEYWGDPLYSAGKGSFVSELIALAGGDNIGDEVATPYFQASPEWVLTRNPEVIFCFYHADGASPADRVRARRAWATVDAVRNGRVYDDFDSDEILRPGPRVMRGVAQLRARLDDVRAQTEEAP